MKLLFLQQWPGKKTKAQNHNILFLMFHHYSAHSH